jgi:mevalonate kinase
MKAIAPGKLILSGEHAVVYGRPAIAMAIDRSAVAEVTPGAEGEDRVSIDLKDLTQRESYTLLALQDFKSRVAKNYRMFLNGELGIREVLRKPIDLFEYAFIILLDGLHLKLRHGLDIRLQSNIPMGCGLGSSAATILSVLRAVGHYFRVEFRPDWYYEYSLEAERMQHGFPSGVDSYISLHGGCARFRNGHAERIPLPRLPLTLVNTGTPITTTGECVAEVRRRHEKDNALWDEFEATTVRLEKALARNDTEEALEAIRGNHRLLRRIGVVPDRVSDFIAAVENRGGAAKICGAGAAGGEAGGVVLVTGIRPPADLCEAFGYSLVSVRGEPLGVRIV